MPLIISISPMGTVGGLGVTTTTSGLLYLGEQLLFNSEDLTYAD